MTEPVTHDIPKLSVCLNCLSLISFIEFNDFDGCCEKCAVLLQGIVDGTAERGKD
jgi:hypothetical protein